MTIITAKRLAIVFAIACVVIDILPQHGTPHFRYTGSDPARGVWNLGWPMPLFIYDPQSGFHVGPSIYVVAPIQGLIGVFIAATTCFRKRRICISASTQ